MMIAGLVLAGGAGTRMGTPHRLKPLTLLHGRPLAAHAADALAGLDPILVSGPAGRGLEALGRPVIRDLRVSSHGPLAGLEAAYAHLSTAFPQVTHILSVPGDTPFLPRDLVSAMITGTDGRIAVAASGGQLHPTAALWPMTVLAGLRTWMDGTERRALRAFIGAEEWRVVDFPVAGPIDPFFNVNTPQDLAVAASVPPRNA